MNLGQTFVLIISSTIIANCEVYGNVSKPKNKYMVQWNKNQRVENPNWFWSSLRDTFAGDNRQSRFLSLFTVVNIDKDSCISTTGDSGICLTQSECQKRGGTPNGACAGGYAQCCVFAVTCGAAVRENGTYFVNRGYPNQYDGSGTCQITLIKTKVDVCQYRLDFDQFFLMGPEPMNNICNNDQFIVTGANPTPTICGINGGNHMYIDSGEGLSNPIIVSVVTSGPKYMRAWKIRITQIPCLSLNRGEHGCLQYYTGVSGQIRSFNYDPSIGLQLSNQDYSICIRTEKNFCSIHYTQCPDTVNNRSQSFSLSGNSSAIITSMVGSTGTTNFCQADYIVIPMVSNVGRAPLPPTLSTDRLCGGVLNFEINSAQATIRSGVKPFRIWFHTDNVEAPTDVMNRGFCLNYVQQTCISGA